MQTFFTVMLNGSKTMALFYALQFLVFVREFLLFRTQLHFLRVLWRFDMGMA